MVQFWVALEKEKRITINNALRGKEYECLECHGKMIPKKGEITSWHFAHKSDFSCKGEGQKHLYIKELIYEILSMGSTLLTYSLGYRVTKEKAHLGLIPDVCMFWADGDFLAIEVCDTNKASEEKIQKYGENMIEFDISSWGEEQINNPFFVFNVIYPPIFFKLRGKEIKFCNKRVEDKQQEIQLLKQQMNRCEKTFIFRGEKQICFGKAHIIIPFKNQIYVPKKGSLCELTQKGKPTILIRIEEMDGEFVIRYKDEYERWY